MGGNITDLTGLEHCTNLTQLYLSGNQISDLSPLSSLTSLTRLYLGNNEISDISPLSSLTSLTELDLCNNDIRDASPLSSLINLTYLDLGFVGVCIGPSCKRNYIRDASPLSSLTNLTYLDLTYNGITDASPLSNLTNLRHLDLYEDMIIDISPLSNLANLTYLNLYSNWVNDIKPLVDNAGLSEGDTVNLRYNPLSAASINTYIPQLQVRGVEVLYSIDQPPTEPPNQPSNISPADEATEITVAPILQSSAFSDPDADDTHAASWWQVTTTSGDYSSPLFDSLRCTHLTSITVPLLGRLNYNTTYYWRVRHQDNNGAWSDWSEEISFTTISSPAPSPTTGGVPVGSWIIIGVGAAVVIGIVVWRLSVRRGATKA
jgi:Leucine-rich repeat (LRR) protein